MARRDPRRQDRAIEFVDMSAIVARMQLAFFDEPG
jgi:hypothetical protein